jgi:cytochrome c biogenesis protein CcmG, thiol:disulfide interchange protein DsbE
MSGIGSLRGKLRFLLPLGVFVLLLAVLAVGLLHAPEKGILPSPLIGKSAPPFSVPSLFAGQGQVSSEQLKGRWTLVNVWGSWCVTCRAEHPTLLMIKQQAQVPIIGIDWNDDEADARDWLSQLGNPYSAVGEDHEGKVAIDFGVYGAPESFLVNPTGKIVYKQVGAMTPDIWRREFLARINAASRSGGASRALNSGAAGATATQDR